MVIKIFDKPIKATGGYLNGLDIDNIIENRSEALMIIRQKHHYEDEWEYLIDHVKEENINGYCFWVWENDWYEGEKYVELLGWMENLLGMSSYDTERLYNILKEIKESEEK